MKYLILDNESIKRFSPLSGNLDDDKLSSYVEVAQDIHLQSYLGTDLYNAIQTYALTDAMPQEYTDLIDNYIKPMLMRWTLVEFIPFAPYNVSNKGVFKGTSENSDVVSKDELDEMSKKYEALALHYTKRLVDYLCDNSQTFPEYSTNIGSDMRPNRGLPSYGGLYLD
mgnify:FL=1|tara:strand:- start:1304 stop:1807 length:504 start_codon:yes stop_codon:yes gene_type:complete